MVVIEIHLYFYSLKQTEQFISMYIGKKFDDLNIINHRQPL